MIPLVGTISTRAVAHRRQERSERPHNETEPSRLAMVLWRPINRGYNKSCMAIFGHIDPTNSNASQCERSPLIRKRQALRSFSQFETWPINAPVGRSRQPFSLPTRTYAQGKLHRTSQSRTVILPLVS